MLYKTIFHIDDDLDDCLIFKDAVNAISDARYIWENNPIIALQKLISGEISPQVIFLDLNMTILSGHEFLSEMRKYSNISAIPVIIFSTSLIGFNVDSKWCNVLMHYTKPSDYNHLKAIMNEIISGIE